MDIMAHVQKRGHFQTDFCALSKGICKVLNQDLKRGVQIKNDVFY